MTPNALHFSFIVGASWDGMHGLCACSELVRLPATLYPHMFMMPVQGEVSCASEKLTSCAGSNLFSEL